MCTPDGFNTRNQTTGKSLNDLIPRFPSQTPNPVSPTTPAPETTPGESPIVPTQDAPLRYIKRRSQLSIKTGGSGSGLSVPL